MLDAILATLRERPAMGATMAAVRAGGDVCLEGLSGSHLAAVLSEAQIVAARPLAVVVPADLDLERVLLDLRCVHERRAGAVVAFPPLEVNPYGSVPPHDDIVRERLQTLDRCSRGRVDIMLAPVRCWMERIQSPERFRERSRWIETGTEIEPARLTRHLVDSGYRRVALVESLGEFAVRGGIVDIFPPTREHPVRLDFLGDDIESIREFNPRDQRSMRSVDGFKLPPATSRTADDPAEVASDRTTLQAALADYLAEPAWVEIEPEVVDSNAERWHEYVEEHYHQALSAGQDAPLPDQLMHDLEHALARKSAATRIRATELASGVGESIVHTAQSVTSYRGRLAELAHSLKLELDTGERVAFMMSKSGKAERLAEILEGYGVPVTLQLDDPEQSTSPAEAVPLPPGTCRVGCAELSGGFRLPDIGFWLGTDAEVFGRSRPPGRSRRFRGDAFRGDFSDLQPGDFVIHEDHGIGRFAGVRQLPAGDSTVEFMEIEYRAGDRLYLPLDQLYLVQKYQAGEEARAKIDKLGGTSWSKVKGRVRESLRELASDLLELYAGRKAAVGYSFGADTAWQGELEDSFEYDETADQLVAIAEVKADMESGAVMDRLLCGDVGYGKTEVAMRAAFKAVMEGKQVAFLAPTTILAYQHWRTLQARFAAFPVRVDMLSRFRTSAQIRATVAAIRDSRVDVAVGTHRLLGKDVEFKDLGLLVVDEEQRFGVGQKERLKRLKRSVDVLAMTATPIPRTLQMSLLGVRDLSVIETPPKDRYAIATHIVPYDREIITDALHEELSRGGQVFFVHNRIESIYRVAAALKGFVPEAEFRVAHGQLPKAELERVMFDFVEGRADVLITTAIIENGLDIPMANTIIVNRADAFGLAQLYQLRGRVGRSTRRAYAYLIVPPIDTLTPVAKKRLRAIQEFSDLGSGFRLAAMDLEIRGAGSLLGERQHGHIAAVGFELYARMLEEAVHELKGEPVASERRAQLSLGIDLQIPVGYVEDPLQRLMVSKRLASARTDDKLERLQAELRDRYGALPREVERLFAYASLRLAAETQGVLSVERKGDGVLIRLSEDAPVAMDRLIAQVEAERGWKLAPPDGVLVALDVRSPTGLLAAVREVLEVLS